MGISNFDIQKFIRDYEPFRIENKENFESMQNSLEELLSLFETDSEHVFGKFPLNEYNQDEIELFLKMILKNKYEESREAVSLVNKISSDRNLEGWILYKPEDDSIDLSLESIPNFEPIDFVSEMLYARAFIRLGKDNGEHTLKTLLEVNDSLYYEFHNEKNMLFMIGLGYENYGYIKDYIEYVVDSFLQVVVYCIIANYGIDNMKKSSVLGNLSKTIDDLSDAMNFQISRKRDERQAAIKKNQSESMEIENASLLFYYYLSLRSKYGEQINICKELKREEEDETELFKDVDEEFITSKEPCDISEAKRIITEGTNPREYQRKLEEACEIIDIFSRYGGRDINPYNTQDVKVHFRELFISNSRYKRKAMTIAREYLKTCIENQCVEDFEKKSEYIFLREKITRGYFREKNTLFLYHMKNEIQEKFYDIMIRIFLLYDYNFSMAIIHDVNRKLLESVLESYKA